MGWRSCNWCSCVFPAALNDESSNLPSQSVVCADTSLSAKGADARNVLTSFDVLRATRRGLEDAVLENYKPLADRGFS